MRNTALPWSVSCTRLYTAVSTLHSRTMSIVFITASSTLYNNWSVQWKYDLERSIPQIINPLHQPLRCLCTEQCTVQHTVYFAVFYTVQYDEQYSIQYNIQEEIKEELLREYVNYASQMNICLQYSESTTYTTIHNIVWSEVLRKEHYS